MLGEKFFLDTAADANNTVAENYWDEDFDALTCNWKQGHGRWLWCNPPYDNKLPWIKKFETARKVCLLLPQSSWEYWWLDAMRVSHLALNISGRVHCKLPADAPEFDDDGKKLNDSGPNCGSTVFVRGPVLPSMNKYTLAREGKVYYLDKPRIVKLCPPP